MVQHVHLGGRSEKHRCSVTSHTAGQNDRLPDQWTKVARINLETEISFLKYGLAPIGRRYLKSVAVPTDSDDLALQFDRFKVWKLGSRCDRWSRSTY
jgi:hypothetical protein